MVSREQILLGEIRKQDLIDNCFLGSENGLQVYQIFFESGNMAKILPEYLSKWTMERVQDQGVCVIPKTQIDEANFQNNQVKLQLSNGKTVMVDHVSGFMFVVLLTLRHMFL